MTTILWLTVPVHTNLRHKFKFLVHSREKTNHSIIYCSCPHNLRHKLKFLVHSREKTNLTTALLTVPVHTNLRHRFKFLVQQREDKLNHSIIDCSCPRKFKTQIEILRT